jgi:hypothetical protein
MFESVDLADCGSSIMHSAHTYRTGFLWLTKNECSGSRYPAYLEPLNADLEPKVEHRHKFILQLPQENPYLNPAKTIWYCDCGQWVTCDREKFHKVLLDVSARYRCLKVNRASS